MPHAANADFDSLRNDIRQLSDVVGTFTRAVEDVNARGNMQTVVHKSSAGGFVTGLAVAACIGSFFFTMYVARTVNNDMRDQKAWIEVLRAKVSVLEGKH